MDECINCGAYEPECPNNAIDEASVDCSMHEDDIVETEEQLLAKNNFYIWNKSNESYFFI